MFSGLFYLFPRLRAGASEEDLQRANLEWFRLREQELVLENDAGVQDDAKLRLLEDEKNPLNNSCASGQKPDPI